MAKAAKDRVKELRWVQASELIPNPRNWREHPEAQREAMRGVMAEIGVANAVLCRETSDGLQIIDGHLRQELLNEQPIPVLVLDVTGKEADKLMLTLDPLAAMAGMNQDNFQALLESTKFRSEAIKSLMESLSQGSNPPSANGYVQTVDIPIYHPTGPQPAIEELTDRSTADRLIDEIIRSELPKDVQQFLLAAAERHVAFNFERIANYYAHASTDMQVLMERSALVIVDYAQAIANGFVHLGNDIDAAFAEDYPHA